MKHGLFMPVMILLALVVGSAEAKDYRVSEKEFGKVIETVQTSDHFDSQAVPTASLSKGSIIAFSVFDEAPQVLFKSREVVLMNRQLEEWAYLSTPIKVSRRRHYRLWVVWDGINRVERENSYGEMERIRAATGRVIAIAASNSDQLLKNSDRPDDGDYYVFMDAKSIKKVTR